MNSFVFYPFLILLLATTSFGDAVCPSNGYQCVPEFENVYPEPPLNFDDDFVGFEGSGDIQNWSNMTKKSIPPIRPSVDGRIGFIPQNHGGGYDLWYLMPEALNQHIHDNAAAAGSSEMARYLGNFSQSQFITNNGGGGNHLLFCDLSLGMADGGPGDLPSGITTNPYRCRDNGSGLHIPDANGPDDCYEMRTFVSARNGSNLLGHQRDVSIRISNPKNPRLVQSVDMYFRNPASVAVTWNNFVTIFEPQFASTNTGHIFMGRGDNFTLPTNDNQDVIAAGMTTRVYDAFYSFYPSSADSRPCQFSNFNRLRPVAHAPYQSDSSQMEVFRFKFRSPMGDEYNEWDDIKSSGNNGTNGVAYPWINQRATMLQLQFGGSRFAERADLNTYPRWVQYPYRCQDGTTNCEWEGVQQVGNFAEAFRTHAVAGLWSKGQFVILDSILNKDDFTFGEGPTNAAIKSVKIYDSGPDVRIGPGRVIGRFGIQGFGGNLALFESIDTTFNFYENVAPRSPADVVWTVSNGITSDEIKFDDMINKYFLIKSSGVGAMGSTNGSYWDGWNPNTHDFSEEVRLQNSAASSQFNVPPYGQVVNNGGAHNLSRIEPVSQGGIDGGKGFWLNGAAQIDYDIPLTQTVQPQDIDSWYVSFFLDNRDESTSNRVLVKYSTGESVYLQNVSGDLRLFFQSAGATTSTSLAARHMGSAWNHVGYRTMINNATNTTTIRVFLNGLPLGSLMTHIHASDPFEISSGDTLSFGSTSSGFRGWIDEIRVIAEELTTQTSDTAVGRDIPWVNPASACQYANGELVHLAASLDGSDPFYAHYVGTGYDQATLRSQLNNFFFNPNPWQSSDNFACIHHYQDRGGLLGSYSSLMKDEYQSLNPDVLHWGFEVDAITGLTKIPEVKANRHIGVEPRRDASDNGFCLSCHNSEHGNYKLGLAALRSTQEAHGQIFTHKDDPRRGATQPPRTFSGMVPPAIEETVTSVSLFTLGSGSSTLFDTDEYVFALVPGLNRVVPVPDPLVFSDLAFRSYNGVNSNVQSPHTAPLNMGDDTFTLSARIRPDAFGNYDGIITKGTESSPYAMQVWSDGSLRLALNYAFNQPENNFNSDTKMTAGNWYDVAITYDGSDVKFYIDGQLDTNQPSPGLSLNDNFENLVLGVDLPGGDEYFAGIIGNVKIHDVALNQAAVQDLRGPVYDEPGIYSYDGFSENRQVPHQAAFDLHSTLTLAAYICPSSFGNWDGIITKGVNNGPYAMQVWGNGSLRFASNWGFPNGFQGGGEWNSTATMTAGNCYDVAVTYDGTTVRFYIDGVLDSNQPVPSPSLIFGTNSENLVVGADFPGGDEYFHGDIGKVKIFNRTLSQSEIQGLMGAPDTTAPISGGGLTASNPSQTSIDLTWTPATDDISPAENLTYTVYYSTSSLGNTVASVEAGIPYGLTLPNNTSRTVSSLTPSTTYFFSIVVADDAGNKAIYNEASLATSAPETIPPTPGGNLATSNPTQSSISLSWSLATDNETSQSNLRYQVYYGTSSLGSSVASVEAGTTFGASAMNISSTLVTGLTPSTNYYFNVVVEDLQGNKAIYTEATATTLLPDTTPPTPGGSLSTSNITPTSVELAWNLSADNESAQGDLTYQVYYSTSSMGSSVATVEAATAFGSETVNISSLFVSGLANATTYFFNVVVADLEGNKAIYSEVSVTTLQNQTPPTVTGGIFVTSANETSVTIEWDAAVDDSSVQAMLTYQVYYSQSPMGQTVAEVETGTAFESSVANITSKVVTGLSNNTTYYFNAIVADEAGNKTVYSEASQMTQTPGPIFEDLVSRNYNGTSDVTLHPHTAAMVTSSLTLAANICPRSFGNFDGIITKGVNTSTYAMQLWSDGGLQFLSNGTNPPGSVNNSFWRSNIKMVAGRCYDVAVTFDGTTVRFYIDGVLDTNQPVPSPAIVFGINTEDLTIGSDLEGGDEYFDGDIAKVRVYNRALSQSEIEGLRGPQYEDLASREYNGTNDNVQQAHGNEIAFHQQLTLMANICPDSFGDWEGVISKGTNTSPYAMQVWGDGSLRFASNWGRPSGAIGGGEWNSTTKLTAGSCHDVAITYDGTTVRFYIDGNLDSNQPVPSPPLTFGTNTEPLVLGADFPGGDEFFDGDISKVKLYNRALSSSEIGSGILLAH